MTNFDVLMIILIFIMTTAYSIWKDREAKWRNKFLSTGSNFIPSESNIIIYDYDKSDAIRYAQLRTKEESEWVWSKKEQATMALYCLWASEQLDKLNKNKASMKNELDATHMFLQNRQM